MTKSNTLTEFETTFLDLVEAADENDKALIITVLLCAVKYREEFYTAVKEYVDNGDGKAIRSIVASYKARLEREERK